MLVVVLDGEAEDAAGLVAPVVFIQQGAEGREVVGVSPVGQVQVRIEEGHEDDDDPHDAERIDDDVLRQQGPGDVAGQQDALQGQQGNDAVHAQLADMAQHADGAEHQVAPRADIGDRGQRAGMVSVIHAEKPVGDGIDKHQENTGEIDHRVIFPQRMAHQHIGIQHADREHEEHIGTGEAEDIEKGVEDDQEGRVMGLPGFIQAGCDALKQLQADIDDQNREEGAVQPDLQPGPEKIVAHDDE